MPGSVRHLTFSSSGGAGVVATRVSRAISEMGWDSEVVSSTDSDLRSSPLQHPFHTADAAIDNFVIKSPGWPSLISLNRDRQSANVRGIAEADVVHLHWINGVFPLKQTPFSLDAPVVWTLHDMNPMTGACHHSFSCRGFETSCFDCPAVRGAYRKAVHRHFSDKIEAINRWERLTLVSPSRWLAEQAKRSALFQDREISVIHNPLDGKFFSTPLLTSEGEIVRSETTFVLVASDLDDPIKDVIFAVEAYLGSRADNPNSRLVLVGRGGARFKGIPGVTLAGALSPEGLIALFDQSDALIISSQAENSPSVAYEAASRGLTPIVRRTGGLPEVVDNIDAGYVFGSSRELVDIVLTISSGTASRSRRRDIADKAKSLCAPEVAAAKYIEIYEVLQ